MLKHFLILGRHLCLNVKSVHSFSLSNHSCNIDSLTASLSTVDCLSVPIDCLPVHHRLYSCPHRLSPEPIDCLLVHHRLPPCPPETASQFCWTGLLHIALIIVLCFGAPLAHALYTISNYNA